MAYGVNGLLICFVTIKTWKLHVSLIQLELTDRGETCLWIDIENVRSTVEKCDILF